MPTLTYRAGRKTNDEGGFILAKTGEYKGKPKEKRVVSVTSICREFENEENLNDWYFKMGKEGQNPYKKGKYARGVGTIAHKMAENFVHFADIDAELPSAAQIGMHPEDYPAAMVSAEKAFTAFRTWWEMNGFQMEASEVSLVSDEQLYGGTPDLVARSKKYGNVLVDMKSKDFYDDFGVKKNIWLSTKDAVQLGAYSYLWEHGRMNVNQGVKVDEKLEKFDGGHTPPDRLGENIDHLVILQLSRQTEEFDGVLMGRDEIEYLQEYFIHLRRCYDLKKKTQKSMQDGRSQFRRMFLA